MAKGYSPKLKFQVVLELIRSEKNAAQLARIYDVHPNTIRNWETKFKEKGPEIFSGDKEIARYEKRLSEMEQLLGKKEVEIALLKNFLGQGN